MSPRFNIWTSKLFLHYKLLIGIVFFSTTRWTTSQRQTSPTTLEFHQAPTISSGLEKIFSLCTSFFLILNSSFWFWPCQPLGPEKDLCLLCVPLYLSTRTPIRLAVVRSYVHCTRSHCAFHFQKNLFLYSKFDSGQTCHRSSGRNKDHNSSGAGVHICYTQPTQCSKWWIVHLAPLNMLKCGR